MSKTIRQLANEIGVSKQAVQKRIAREPLCTSIQEYISTVQGTKYIDVVGENLIKQAFLKNSQQPVHSNKTNDVDNDVYTILKTTIDTLKGQLEIKDKQIEELNNRLAESHELIDKAQNLHGADKAIEYYKKQYLISDETEELEKEKKPSFWSRLFKNKNAAKEVKISNNEINIK